MKSLRASLSAVLALTLVLLSPGGAAWAAMGKVATPAFTGARVAPVPAASFGVRDGLSLSGALGVPQASLAPALGAAAFQAPAPAAVAAVPAVAPAPAASLAAPQAARRSPNVPVPAAPSASPAAPGQAAAPLAALEAAGEQAAALSAPEGGDAAAKDRAAASFDLSRARPNGLSLDLGVTAESRGRANFAASLKKGGKGTPDRYDEQGNPDDGRSGDIDELGNERRRGGEGGPDDTTDPDGGGRDGGSTLFAAVGLAGAGLAFGGFSFSSLLAFPLVLGSIILHEIGHAKAAASLGDHTATLEGRASFHPKSWWTHVDPMMTIVLPLVTMLSAGFILGGAKPVPVNTYNFRDPVKDMAKVAFVGPAVNFILAIAGSLAVTGALAAGLGAAVAGALVTFTFLNVALGVFNLMPLHPLDGSHILRALLPRPLAASLDAFYDRLGAMSWLPLIAVTLLGGGMIVAVAMGVTKFLVAVPLSISGLQAAAAWALTAGMLGGALAPAKPAASAASDAPAIPAEGSAAVDLVVAFGPGGLQGVTRDEHLSWVDLNEPNGVDVYAQAQLSMTSQIESAGALGPGALATMGATPIATYRRINAATVRLDAARAGEFEKEMRARGHAVFANSRREIVRPVTPEPERMEPSARGAVTMEENLQITKADKVHEIARAMWGEPGQEGGFRAFMRRLFGTTPAQPRTAVIDSGADLEHPLLRSVREVKNATSGENVDDIGHGTWVHSMGLNYAPWARNSTHYKTFVGGGATLDDILKALTMSANDGNLVMSNSWGSDEGDPQSPDSRLVRKLAEEGHIMVFAAGNSGSRPNSIGSPAIVYHRDAATGAIRVVSVAATDRNKKVAFFSSRGPGSYKTRSDAAYPKRPDLSAVGYNTEGAWPAALRDADRTDPVKGPLKAISGTSMSTPSVYGAILLLMMMFGVTQKGPAADAVVNAVMQSLEKTGQGHDNEGDGFMNVQAAYERLHKEFFPGQVPPTALQRYRQLKAEADASPRAAADLRERLEALEAEYPAISGRPAGLGTRAWDSLSGRAPVPAHVAEYRRLVAALERAEDESLAYRRDAAEAPDWVRDTLLTRLENEYDPKIGALRAALNALTAAHPDVKYQSASPVGRWWMRVTGRGPAA